MRFIETALSGAFVIEQDRIEDERGYFARTWCDREFAEHGLNTAISQCNVSWNRARGTVRGMHYQIDPHGEAKVIRCTRGAIYDVVIDIRPGSPTCGRWIDVELTADNHRMLFVPEGFAHGFQSLVDDCEVFYQLSESYHPQSLAGIRYDDPAFGIDWPLEVSCVSPRDLAFAPYQRKVLA